MKQVLFLLVITFSFCAEDPLVQPRPRQFPRIYYPEKNYAEVVLPQCNLAVMVPEYTEVNLKRNNNKTEGYGCWFDLAFPQFDATLYCSYYEIVDNRSLSKLINDAYEMVSKHNAKASFREENAIVSRNGSSGKIFKLEGPVASPYQFYLTDSTRHFLRGSFYFNQKVDRDSIKDIYLFLEKDIEHLINTVDWK